MRHSPALQIGCGAQADGRNKVSPIWMTRTELSPSSSSSSDHYLAASASTSCSVDDRVQGAVQLLIANTGELHLQREGLRATPLVSQRSYMSTEDKHYFADCNASFGCRESRKHGKRRREAESTTCAGGEARCACIQLG